MSKWWQYIINPIGSLASDVVRGIQRKAESYLPYTENGEPIETFNPNMIRGKSRIGQDLTDFFNLTKDTAQDLWDDYTGKSQIKLQNQLNREMAEEEYQRNLQSIGDTASAYEAAGLNRNLLYGSGGSPMSYSAPDLQAYSGSAKLDTILNRVGKLVGMIPAFYQATAALEGIDQARERTKQSEIKTMSMGMSLLDQGYRLGDNFLSKPFVPQFRNGMNPLYYMFPRQRGDYSYDGKILRSGDLAAYADSSLKHQFDLLESIGISNQLRQTRNSYLGYQYDLDRRFGAAGRIVGMASQGLGAASRLMTPSALKFWGFK